MTVRLLYRLIALCMGILAGRVFAQQEKAIVEDFNRDGFDDTITWETDYGTSFSYTRYVLIDGKANKNFKVERGGCYCEMLDIVAIPESLMDREYVWARRALQQQWDQTSRQLTPDPSLRWLISAYFHNQKTEQSTFFTQIISPDNQWIQGEMAIPPNYSIQISGDTLTRLADIFRSYYLADWDRSEESPNGSLNQAWLIYYAHNLGLNNPRSPQPVFSFEDASDKYRLHKTAHGVVLQEGKRYKWVFINDAMLTDGPEKLRWSSIKDARLAGNMIIIHHSGGLAGGEHLFLADIATGKVGRVNLNPDDPEYALEEIRFRVENDQLIVQIPELGSKPRVFCLTDLHQALIK